MVWEKHTMIKCPVCGWKMQRGDLKHRRFACPGCKERLRWHEPQNTGTVMLGSALVAILISYFGEDNLLRYTFIVYLVIVIAYSLLRELFFGRLEIDHGEEDGKILRF
jgi:hypothetical protein